MKKVIFFTSVLVLLFFGSFFFFLLRHQSKPQGKPTNSQQQGVLSASFSKREDSVRMEIKAGAGQAGIETPLLVAQDVSTNNQDGEYTYKSQTDGTEIRYKKIEKGTKEEIVLSKPPTSNIFTVKMELEGLTPKTNDQGLVVFYDSKNNYQFHFDKPFAIDASGIKTEDLNYQIRRRIGEETDPKINKYNVILEIDKSWLSDPKRTYPITIDPTVIADQEEAGVTPVSNQTWQEVSGKRNQTSKTYQNTENPAKYSWDGTLATIHYESVPDSGNFDTPIDMTPVLVNDKSPDGLNGWQITQNGWHYRLGTPKDKGGEDGWVGFGGRNGEKWFNFRLAQVGYLDWNNKSFEDVGGAINYDRKNLSAELNFLPFGPNNEQLPIESVLSWNDLWTTPGEGTLGIRWRVNGNELKEEIVINQKAREYIKTNKSPKGKKDGTYFGFVFEIDWDDIPKVIRNGALKSKSANLDLVDDGKNIEFKDEMDRLLAFMPISDAWVNDENGQEIANSRVELKKRFYIQGNNTYLMVGLSTETLDSLPAGDLIVDPTVDYAVGATANDGSWGSASYFSATDDFVGQSGGAGYHEFSLFTGVAVPKAATIDVAYTSYCAYSQTGSGGWKFKVYGNDADNPAAPTSWAACNGLALTAGSAQWAPAAWNTSTWYNAPSISVGIGTITSRAQWASGNAVLTALKDDTSKAGSYVLPYDYSGYASRAATLHIEYTEAPTPTPAGPGPAGLKFEGVKMEGVKVD